MSFSGSTAAPAAPPAKKPPPPSEPTPQTQPSRGGGPPPRATVASGAGGGGGGGGGKNPAGDRIEVGSRSHGGSPPRLGKYLGEPLDDHRKWWLLGLLILGVIVLVIFAMNGGLKEWSRILG